MQKSGGRPTFEGDGGGYERGHTSRRRIQVNYDSDPELEAEVDDFFGPRKDRVVYRVYDGEGRGPEEERRGKRISVVSVTSDDDADEARLRHIQKQQQQQQRQQQQQQQQQQQWQDYDEEDSPAGPVTVQIGDDAMTSQKHVTHTYEVTSSTHHAASPEPEDLPPLITQNEDAQLINGDADALHNQERGSDRDPVTLPAPVFLDIPDEHLIQQTKTDMKKSGSIRSLREVMAAQKGKTPPPARKERGKLALSPSDPLFDNILNGSTTTTTTTVTHESRSQGGGGAPPAPPPPPINGHAQTTTQTTKTVYSKTSDNAGGSGVVMRRKEKKKEDFRGSQKSLGASKLAGQQEHEFRNEQAIAPNIHDSLRDLDMYLKEQKDGDSVSLSSHASSKQLEQFHFALTDESTPM